MDSAAVLRLEIVIVLAAPLLPTLTVPKLMELGLTLLAVKPVPVTLSVSGLLLWLPGIFMVADSLPTVVGVNTTVYVHEPLTGIVWVHRFVVKSPPLAPVNVTGFRVIGAVPILVTVTLKGLLADSNTVPVKARLWTESWPFAEPVPTPESETVCGLLGSESVIVKAPL
jgi:hypothetical protein